MEVSYLNSVEVRASKPCPKQLLASSKPKHPHVAEVVGNDPTEVTVHVGFKLPHNLVYPHKMCF